MLASPVMSRRTPQAQAFHCPRSRQVGRRLAFVANPPVDLHSCISPQVRRTLDRVRTFWQVSMKQTLRSHCPTITRKISKTAERSVQAGAGSVQVIYIGGTTDRFKSIGRGYKLLTGEFSML